MAIVNATAGVESIGQTAGDVWHLLNEQGPMPITKLIKEIDAPRDLVLQALGWLAREDKIAIEEVARRKMISLRE
jgi:hypothetical protein